MTHKLVMQDAALLLLGRLWKAEVQERRLVKKVLANPLATFPLDLQQTTFMFAGNIDIFFAFKMALPRFFHHRRLYNEGRE
jgi:hypothetical protein